MNILSQLLNIETKNLIINKTLSDIKYEITNFFESSINIFEGNFYLNFIIHLQKFMNEHIINIIHNIINYMDNEFKNSNDRKKTYYINKPQKLLYDTINIPHDLRNIWNHSIPFRCT